MEMELQKRVGAASSSMMQDTRVLRLDAVGPSWKTKSTSARAAGGVLNIGRADVEAYSWIPGEYPYADNGVHGRQRQRQGNVHEHRTQASSAPGAELRNTPRVDKPVEDTTPHLDVAASSAGRGLTLDDDATPHPDAASSSDDRGRTPNRTRDISIQYDEGPAWSKWDMGSAIRGLRSSSLVMVCRTL